ELSAAIQANGLRGGSVVILDPRDGSVLAIAGRPSFAHGPDLYSPSAVGQYGIPAIAESGEPGPAFKVFALAAALDARAIQPNAVFQNHGSFSYAGETVQDLAPEPAGDETYVQALERPSTLAVAWAAMNAGAPAFYATLDRFGFGESTGVDLPGETSGSLRQPTAPDWYALDLATNAAGRGFQSTPIQLAAAAVAVANGGTHYQPYVLKKVVDQTVPQIAPTRGAARVISPEAASALTGLLVAGVDDPASPFHGAAVPGYAVAGTAGTIETPVPNAYNQTQTVATFIGYAPADHPRFVVVVELDGVQDGSAQSAVSAFGAMTRQLLSYYQIPPGRPAR
ncbi:MAG TPA: penicillin-binding transpeptidase domain-containing protein, partial [Chloroflexota bacterium]|nr:penicillin-binding transpeptidase domain-containing protein [Chloroflexota bacterium]